MKLQNLQEAQLVGGEHVPYLVRLHNLVKEHVKPDVTQDEIIRFIAQLEGDSMAEGFGRKDYFWIAYEGMEALKNNPKGANDALEGFIDEDNVEEDLNELANEAKNFFAPRQTI